MVDGDDNREDAGLDALFASARAERPSPSEAFMQRLADEAEAHLSVHKAPVARRGLQPDWIKGLFAALGLSAAAALGVWIGFVMPDFVGGFTFVSEETAELYTLLPGADLAMAYSELDQ